MVFFLETNGPLPEAQTKQMLLEWNEIFPDNKLLIVPKGSLNILDIESK